MRPQSEQTDRSVDEVARCTPVVLNTEVVFLNKVDCGSFQFQIPDSQRLVGDADIDSDSLC